MPALANFRKNVHSQNGEDGVIEEINRRLGLTTGWFVEFGAWDGKHLSNTFLLLEKGWQGIYIEADRQKFATLNTNMAAFQGRATTLCAFVEPEGKNSLDQLLAQTRLPCDFDLLSIDIDTCDWHIWRSLKNYQPKVVVIEINSFIPVGIYQTHRGGAIVGSSFSAMVDLATRKGYHLVCHTGNLIFVRNDLIVKLGLPDDDLHFPETLFDYSSVYLTYDLYIPRIARKFWQALIRLASARHR
jgi:hypothetical protein